MGAMDIYVSYAPNSDDSGYDTAGYTDTFGFGAVYNGDITVAAGIESASANAAANCSGIAASGLAAGTAADTMDAIYGGTSCGDQTLTYVGAEMAVADMTIKAGYNLLDTDEADTTGMGLGLSTSVGDEGGFAPMINSNNQALDLIVSAIKKAGFKNGKDVSICLDVAANELFRNKKYSIHSKNYISVEKSIKEYQKIIKKYKIKSIEDPFAEDDWLAWNKLMKSTNNVQIVGDDLYVTNLERLKKGFLNISSNSILIKLNQIGTVSETLDVIKFAQTIGYKTIISHRSGESEDTFIADLAVGTNSNQIKTGSLARSERVAKYNQLLRIEEELGKTVRMNKIN